MKATPSTRRKFLRAASTAATAFTVLPRHVLGGPRFVPPSERVNVGVVGVGGRGLQNLRALLDLADVRVTAVADPAREFSLEAFYYKGAGGRAPARAAVEKRHGESEPGFRCAEYEDFRVMLDREKSLDAVLCATPDHLHAAISLRALRSGRHVYCEKPLTLTVREGRVLTDLARRHGRILQTGTQQRSNKSFRKAAEIVRNGWIGRASCRERVCLYV